MSELRFAILHHFGWPDRSDHFDLLLQTEAATDPDAKVLLAFATAEDMFSEKKILLHKIRTHRLIYLTYEGPISNNRGRVKRLDEGTLRWISKATHDLAFALDGTKLHGKFSIIAKDHTYVFSRFQ